MHFHMIKRITGNYYNHLLMYNAEGSVAHWSTLISNGGKNATFQWQLSSWKLTNFVKFYKKTLFN